MASKGNLLGKGVLVLTVDGAKLQDGLDKAKKTLGGFASGILKEAGDFTGLGSFGTGALAGLTALGAAAMRAGDAAESVLNMAENFGIAAEQMQAFQMVAKMSGTSAEVLGKGLKTLAKSISEAVSGDGGEAATALKNLRLDPKELHAADFGQSALKIGNAIASIQNPTDRARMALKLFGKAGLDMLPVFSMGPEKLKAAMADAMRFSQTGATLGNVDAAGDSWSRALESLKAIGMSLIAAATALQPIVDLVAEIVLAFKPLFTAIADGFQFIGAMVAEVLRWLAEGIKALAQLTAKLGLPGDKEIEAYAAAFAKKMEETRDRLAKPMAERFGFKDAVEPVKQLDLAAVEAETALAQLRSELQKQEALLGKGSAAAKVYDLQMKNASAATIKQAEALAKQKEAFDLTSPLVKGGDPVSTFNTQMSQLADWLDRGIIKWDDYNAAVTAAGKALIQATGGGAVKLPDALRADSIEAVREKIQNRSVADAGGQVQQAMTDAKEIAKAQLEVSKKILAAIKKQNENEPVIFNEI